VHVYHSGTNTEACPPVIVANEVDPDNVSVITITLEIEITFVDMNDVAVEVTVKGWKKNEMKPI
jgi:hypothetical protein